MNLICALFQHKWRFLYKTDKYQYYICSRCGKEAFRELFTFKEQ